MTPRPEPRPIPPPIVLTCTDHVLCPASPLSLAVLSAGGPSSQLASHISTTLAQSARPKGVIPPLLSTVCWRGEWASGSPWAAAGAAAAAAGAPREKETDETTTSRGIPRDMDEWERWRAEDEAGGGLEQSAQRSAEMEPPAAGDVRDVNRADSSVHAAEAPSLHLRLTQSGLANMLGASSTKPGLTGSDSAGKRKKAKLTDAPGNREDGYNVAPNANFDASSLKLRTPTRDSMTTSGLDTSDLHPAATATPSLAKHLPDRGQQYKSPSEQSGAEKDGARAAEKRRECTVPDGKR